MVITPEMPVAGIITAWEHSKAVFQKYGIPIDSNKPLKEHHQGEELDALIFELNKIIGSSDATCIEGG